MKIALKRLVAHFIDIVILAIILILVQWIVFILFNRSPVEVLEGIAFTMWIFATISVPAWVYFICLEKNLGYTLGKRVFNLSITSNNHTKISYKQALGRTFIKLLPWELTHIFFFSQYIWWGINNTIYVYLPFIIILTLILFYLFYLFASKNKRAFHDMIFKTKVEKKI